VAFQKDDPNSLFSVYKQVLHLRKQHACLFGGAFEMHSNGNKNVLGFFRSAENEKALIVVNISSSSQVYDLDTDQQNCDWQLAYSTEGYQSGNAAERAISLAPYEAKIFIIPVNR